MNQTAKEITVEEFRRSLESRDFTSLRSILTDLEYADIAEIFSELETPQCIVLFRLIPKKERSETFAYLPFDLQEKLIEELPDNVVTTLINEMEPDDRTKLLEELPFEIRTKILLKLSPEERRLAWKLLSYPEDSVGRLMTPEFIALREDMRVRDAMEFIRWHSNIPEELLHYLYVTDLDGRYLGEVTLAALVVADPPTQPIKQVMDTSRVTLSAYDEDSKAVDLFRKYDRPFYPVVDDRNVLVGTVTADDVFDIAEEEATEDIQQFGGQGVLEDSYFNTPLKTLWRKRGGWLALLFLGEILAGKALREYESTISSMHFLVLFLPLILSSGGNSGSQAASLIIRGIAVKEMNMKDWWKVLSREISMGLGLGCLLGVLGFFSALAWGDGPLVGGVVFVALISVVLFGAVIGSMLPFVFKALRLDPAVSSSPFIALLSDLIGILLFFNIAIFALRFMDL